MPKFNNQSENKYTFILSIYMHTYKRAKNKSKNSIHQKEAYSQHIQTYIPLTMMST